MVSVLAGTYGNPSSVHEEGRRARSSVEEARRRVAGLIAAQTETIVFTSGGTEADALGIVGLARIASKRGRPRVIAVPGIEHPAVHGAVDWLVERGWQAVALPVDSNGAVDGDAFERACADGLGVVAVALANHEVGTVQPLRQLVEVARAHDVLTHADAVQAVGKMPVDVGELDVDSLAISGHKIYGPKGVGALYVKVGLDLAPMFPGGHQERERRPGTENVPGIVGMGVAAELAASLGSGAAVGALRDRLERGLRAIDGATINACDVERVPNTCSVRFDGALGETVVTALDLEGFAVSTGAACTSGSTEPSAVLLAMGRSEPQARECVRFSLGRATTEQDVDRLLSKLPAIVDRARKFG